ncbi:MAG: zinc-ribbon domain-containing protein [Dehalococcoidia bacterium]|nr:zinc-ribbon domain-containing protein [Dehalococcoidia bacterium]
MPFCPNCGKEQVNNPTFCPNCGEKLRSPEDETKPTTVEDAKQPHDNATRHEEPKERQSSEQKRRHGCLTAYLIFAIIVNVGVALYYVLAGLAAFAIGAIFIVLLIFNIICLIALFKWKKWGFWGVVVCIIIGVCLTLYLGLGPESFSGLVGLAVLYGVLQVGKENKGWPQLE